MYVCDHVRASVSGLFKDPSCPVDICPLKSSFTVYQKVPTSKLSVTLSNRNRFCTFFFLSSSAKVSKIGQD